ncbi:hypothetical protein [Streptomyces sp. NBC_00101]|uniref:hypothetical protein n=1 Tax=Streptomyces sp. NBC_00101 TaxID=2975651 RepID=UPI0038674852
MFADLLRELAGRLNPARGWYGIFLRRDPAGMRACFDGVEIPPWDVVESLLQDVAASCGTAFAERESVRAAALYEASAAAHDRRPGGRQELLHRLELMLREQHEAARRLAAAGSGGVRDADPQALAWARDDHRRASARCEEIRTRLAALAVPPARLREDGTSDRSAPNTPSVHPGSPLTAPAPRAAADPGPVGAPEAVRAPEPVRATVAAPAPVPKAARGRPRGARFAGLENADGPDPSALPLLPSAAPSPATPRGARFGGVTRASRDRGPDARGAGGRAEADTTGPAFDPVVVRAAAEVVTHLLAMRAQGRTGEAYAVLCEAAAWPAERLPVLAVALELAGLDADWATLLWEVSSLPPVGLADAVGALAAAGRSGDCGQLLRQGVSRPAEEIAEAAAALERAGRGSEAEELLSAFVRVRSPHDTARVAGAGAAHLVPQLLAAARGVSAAREWDLVHALRVAGVAGV